MKVGSEFPEQLKLLLREEDLKWIFKMRGEEIVASDFYRTLFELTWI